MLSTTSRHNVFGNSEKPGTLDLPENIQVLCLFHLWLLLGTQIYSRMSAFMSLTALKNLEPWIFSGRSRLLPIASLDIPGSLDLPENIQAPGPRAVYQRGHSSRPSMGGGSGFYLLTYFYCPAQRFRTQIHRDPSRSRSVHAHKLIRLCFSSWAAESTCPG